MTMIAYAPSSSIAASHKRGGKKKKKRINGPPPQPSLPAIRHAIVELIVRPTNLGDCPYCKKTNRRKSNGVNKSAKVVLGRELINAE